MPIGMTDRWHTCVVKYAEEVSMPTRSLAASSKSRPQWNFHKYLVDRSGRTVLAYSSEVTPDDAKLVKEIERLLGQR